MIMYLKNGGSLKNRTVIYHYGPNNSNSPENILKCHLVEIT